MSFARQTALITGAANGIGAGLAIHAASLGMRLVLVDVDGDALSALAAKLDGQVDIAVCDVADPDAVTRLADRVHDRMGAIDLLFNNAGIMRTGLSWTLPADVWERCYKINVSGMLNCIRSFLPPMIEADRGMVINTSSVGGFAAGAMLGPYVTTKYAIVALTEALAEELRGIGSSVRAALLAPGAVKSGLVDGAAGADATPANLAFAGRIRSALDEHGLDPMDFAARVFESVARGEFWIFPQPEAIDPTITARARMILDRITPGAEASATAMAWTD